MILSVIAALVFAKLAVPLTLVYADEADKDVANSGYSLSVEAGLDGVLVEGKACPVAVTVSNNSQDFEGVLRVIIPATYVQSSIAYEKNVTIPNGGTKTFSFLLSDIQDVSFLRIELENAKGKIIYSAREKITPFTVGEKAIIGCLSSDYTGLNYFDGASVDTSSGIVQAKMIQLNADNIPEVSDGLEICDFILIDNYNSSQLSEAQQNAIVGWVNNGGILIFGTGAKASVVLEGFTDTVCPIAVGSLSKNSILVDASVTYTLDNVDTVDITAEGWSDLQGSIAVGAPAWQTLYGGGSVLVLSYDLAMNPIANWKEGRVSLAENILSSAGTDAIYDDILYSSADSYGGSYYMEDAVNGVDRNKTPNALLYGALFFLYVIAVGPIAYLILRAMNKREKIWVVMPAITLGFTLIILASSMIYKISKPFIDEISVLEYSNGSVITRTYMSAQSSKGKAYSIDLTEGYNQIASWNDDVAYADYDTTNYSYALVDEGDHISISIEDDMPFTKQSFAAVKQEYQSGTGFDTSLTCTLSGFEGELTNDTGYDLSNVVIYYNDSFIYVGSMKQGETAELHMSDMESINSLSYSLYEWMIDIQDADNSLRGREEYREFLDNQNVYYVMEDRVYDLSVNQGMVFGMIDNYESDIVDNSGVKVYSAGVAVSYFYQMPEEYKNYSFYIGDINDYMVGGDNISYTSDYPEGFDYFYDTDYPEMYVEAMEVLYDFSGVDTTGAQLINTNMYADNDEDYCSVQLYNYTTQQYEDVFVAGVSTVANLHPYINEDGLMQVRYYWDSDDDYWYGYAPNITLVGGEN